MKKVSRAKKIQRLKKKSDKEWAIRVKKRDGYVCRVRGCGKKPAYAHHIFSRRHIATRWDLDNGFTICWGHHKKGHSDYEWLRDEIIAKIGQKKFNRLKEKSKKKCQIVNELKALPWISEEEIE